MDAAGLPPVKSNVDPSQPLREKPPSEDTSIAYRYVSSAPFNYKQDKKEDVQNDFNYNQFTEPSYGPTDFVVETVKLDKDFFHKFFTSKPLLLGTDVVTSTSVRVNSGRKRGRDSSEILEDPEDDEVFENLSKLSEMVLEDTNRVYLQDPIPVYSYTTERMETTTTPPSSTTTLPISRQSDLPIVENNVQKFMRYHIPPEVRVVHQLSVPTESEPFYETAGGPRHAKENKWKGET